MFEPGVPVGKQRESVVVGHQNIGGGTTPYVRDDGKLIGLDTRCYSGGALGGLLLSSKLISVPSRANHRMAMKDLYAHLDATSRGVRDCSLRALEAVATYSYAAQQSAPTFARATTLPEAQEHSISAVDRILEWSTVRRNQIIADLNAEAGFDRLDEKARSRAFAQAVPGDTMAGLLHASRRGTLDRDDLIRWLKTPDAAIELATALGVL